MTKHEAQGLREDIMAGLRRGQTPSNSTDRPPSAKESGPASPKSVQAVRDIRFVVAGMERGFTNSDEMKIRNAPHLLRLVEIYWRSSPPSRWHLVRYRAERENYPFFEAMRSHLSGEFGGPARARLNDRWLSVLATGFEFAFRVSPSSRGTSESRHRPGLTLLVTAAMLSVVIGSVGTYWVGTVSTRPSVGPLQIKNQPNQPDNPSKTAATDARIQAGVKTAVVPRTDLADLPPEFDRGGDTLSDGVGEINSGVLSLDIPDAEASRSYHLQFCRMLPNNSASDPVLDNVQWETGQTISAPALTKGVYRVNLLASPSEPTGSYFLLLIIEGATARQTIQEFDALVLSTRKTQDQGPGLSERRLFLWKKARALGLR